VAKIIGESESGLILNPEKPSVNGAKKRVEKLLFCWFWEMFGQQLNPEFTLS